MEFKIDDAVEQAFRQGRASTEDKRILEIANHYGYPAQSDIMIEESAELTQAILKLRKGYSEERLINLFEEIADVLIMAKQMRILMGADEIDKIIDYKLNRQLSRIEEEGKT